jgi:Mitochondrial K+-H+ exchange-related
MNFYLIQMKKDSVVLYTEEQQVDPASSSDLSSDSSNPLDRFLTRLASKKGRVARSLRNSIVFVREAYAKLEDKIDPMERVLKRLRHTTELDLFYSPSLGESIALKKFEALLSRQKNKHALWAGVDFCLSIFSIALIPIPGPNVFLYYPALRTVSHYLARKGALQGLKLERKRLLPLPEISEIELFLNQQPSEFEKIRSLAEKLKLEQLTPFLERYS